MKLHIADERFQVSGVRYQRNCLVFTSFICQDKNESLFMNSPLSILAKCDK